MEGAERKVRKQTGPSSHPEVVFSSMEQAREWGGWTYQGEKT